MQNNKLKSGFTLIETLVAIIILSAAVAGPMVLSIKNIGTASVSQDQLVAFYLGQEVVEYVRNVRDTNIIKIANEENIEWLDGLNYCKPTDESVGCYIDVISNVVTQCGISCSDNLNFDGTNYNYKNISDTNKKTVFARTVKIDDTIGNGDDEAKVSVSVKWTGKYGEKTMNLQDNIFNWR